MEEPIQGGCACGAIRYELLSRPVDCGWCHCRTCQLNSGAPAMVFAAVPVDDFRIIQGAEKVRNFKSSSFGFRRFCGDCGTPLLMRVDHEPTTVDFSVATLDDPAPFAPEFHIFERSRIAWFETTDSLPRYSRSRHDPPG